VPKKKLMRNSTVTRSFVPISLALGIFLLRLAPIAARGADPAVAQAPPAPPARGATPQQIDAAMKKAVDALYAQQAHGNWETVQQRAPGGLPVNTLQWTGLTAISTYALLCAGESPQDKRLAPAIDFLIANPSQGVYSSASRCLVWSRLAMTSAVHAAAQKDVDFLLKAVKTKGDARGLLWYGLATGPNDVDYDHSTSQMAALGLSVLAAEGFEIPQEFWHVTEQAWQSHQYSDGAWSYIYNGPSDEAVHSAGMTAAGVATLYLTQALLGSYSECHGNPQDPHIDKGLSWLGSNFDATFDVSRETSGGHLEQYALFAISRVGAASGLRYFGTVDWYQRGADFLVATQQPNGTWISGPPGGTPLGLLFLAYGSSPVVVNKLRYSKPAEAGKTPIEQWNQRPQDLLNFVDWMGRRLETRLNWQVVDLASPAQAMHDGPILAICGARALSLSDEERATLRRFVEDGGMIVGNADCDSEKFSKSFVELGAQLFPAYGFRELPATHPIYTSEQYPASKFRRPVHVQGLSNGVRELMLLPSADLSRAFQHRNEKTAPNSYELFDDIVLYAMDTSGLERKGNSYFVTENPAAPIQRTIKLARLRYDGNWDPEPGGCRRLAVILHNNQKIALQVESVKLGDGSLITPSAPVQTVARPSDAEIRQMAVKRIPPADVTAALASDPLKLDAMVKAKIQDIQAELAAADAARAAASANFKLAHLTGTAQLKLTDAQRQELKTFVEAGGTLIIDAAGGSTEFAASVEQMLRDTFGADASEIESPLSPDCPIYQLPGRIVGEIQYRQFARSRLSNIRMPQLRGIKIGGRLAVIYSREDLSAGLVGEPVDGVTGYSPASATELMTNVILYANAPRSAGLSVSPH